MKIEPENIPAIEVVIPHFIEIQGNIIHLDRIDNISCFEDTNSKTSLETFYIRIYFSNRDLDLKYNEKSLRDDMFNKLKTLTVNYSPLFKTVMP